MDQNDAPMLDELGQGRRRHRTGFGAPGHHLGKGSARSVHRALGAPVFAADLTTPKGLDDRTETRHTVQNAHALGAQAWGAELCRYTSCGSTQSLHILLAACVPAGGRVIVARNAHKAEWSSAVIAGYDLVPLPVEIDPVWDIEQTPARAARQSDGGGCGWDDGERSQDDGVPGRRLGPVATGPVDRSRTPEARL